MPTPIKMPALSPTMEEGTLAKWLVKEGDTVTAGDILAEIETDKATMEFETIDDGTVASISVAEGTEGVKVGTIIAMLAEEGEDIEEAKAASEITDKGAAQADELEPDNKAALAPAATAAPAPAKAAEKASGNRIIASPLAKRIAEQNAIDLAGITGSGPNGRIVKADVEGVQTGSKQEAQPDATPSKTDAREAKRALNITEPSSDDQDIPYEATKLNNVRKIIARRLTEAKQTIPHIYLTVDIQLDALLKLRSQMNAALEADGVKLSVNDLLIKALARALLRVPACNVSFRGDELYTYSRADISVAVDAPSGLITPIIVDAAGKGLAQISAEMKELVGKAREGKLQPHEYQGGTASLSNLGMFGIKQFDAVINPPQAMIMAVGAGEKRPYVIDDALQIATVMSATGSFDHRAIDGADGAQIMEAFKSLIEHPMGLVA